MTDHGIYASIDYEAAARDFAKAFRSVAALPGGFPFDALAPETARDLFAAATEAGPAAHHVADALRRLVHRSWEIDPGPEFLGRDETAEDVRRALGTLFSVGIRETPFASATPWVLDRLAEDMKHVGDSLAVLRDMLSEERERRVKACPCCYNRNAAP